MSDKIMDRARAVRLLSVFCPLLYFASYITRKGYGVVMSEVILSVSWEFAAKCLQHAATPFACIPRISAAPIFPARWGSSE